MEKQLGGLCWNDACVKGDEQGYVIPCQQRAGKDVGWCANDFLSFTEQSGRYAHVHLRYQAQGPLRRRIVPLERQYSCRKLTIERTE